jgi:hypothetical protein
MSFYLYDYERELSAIMDLVFVKQDNRILLDALAGVPFDVTNLAQYPLVMKLDSAGDIQQFDVTIGAFELHVKVKKPWMSPTFKGPSNRYYNDVNIVFRHDGNWCGHYNFNLDEMDPENVVDSFMKCATSAIRSRASITIREHNRYLKDTAKYDTLQKLFNIKVR